MPEEGYRRIGSELQAPGNAVGAGLNWPPGDGAGPGTPVGVGIIDAHAGGLGLLGIQINQGGVSQEELEHRLALIGGNA